jgi:hypothetical protein
MAVARSRIVPIGTGSLSQRSPLALVHQRRSLYPETNPPTPIYTLSLDVKKSIPAGAVAVAEFENPATSSNPTSNTAVFKVVSATYVFKPNEKRIRFMSPKLSCVTNGRNYQTLVTLYSNAKRTRVLGTHLQAINFTMTPAQLEEYNIPLCKK